VGASSKISNDLEMAGVETALARIRIGADRAGSTVPLFLSPCSSLAPHRWPRPPRAPQAAP